MEPTMTLDQVRVLFHKHLVNSIGLFLAILFSGGLVTLGIMCLILLPSKGQGSTTQKRIAQIYVVLIVLIVPGYLADEWIALNLKAFQSIYEQNSYLGYVFTILDVVFDLVIVALTDGLLVWRCFVVQRGLGPDNRKLQVLFWIIPMSLWGIIVVAGSTAVGLASACRDYETGPSRCQDLTIIAKLVAIIGNAILNLFAAGYIATLLLIHRRRLIYLRGKNLPTFHHTCIISILLESSAINAPVTILAVVRTYTPALKTRFYPFVLACQAFMSILIVYQVAIDRAFRQRDEDNLEINMERTKKGTSRRPETGYFKHNTVHGSDHE